MINRGQAFVRARVDDGWAAVDVLDLDDESFRRFVTTVLSGIGALTIIKSDDESEPLKAKAGIKKND